MKKESKGEREKKGLGGTSMADMVETEQKLKAMQEGPEWDWCARIKAHQTYGRHRTFFNL